MRRRVKGRRPWRGWMEGSLDLVVVIEEHHLGLGVLIVAKLVLRVGKENMSVAVAMVAVLRNVP